MLNLNFCPSFSSPALLSVIFHSGIFQPCTFVRPFPLRHFPALHFCPSFSTPAFSSPALLSVIFHSGIFQPYTFVRLFPVLHFPPPAMSLSVIFLSVIFSAPSASINRPAAGYARCATAEDRKNRPNNIGLKQLECTGVFNCYCSTELVITQRVDTSVNPFLPGDAMHKRGLFCRPVSAAILKIALCQYVNSQYYPISIKFGTLM